MAAQKTFCKGCVIYKLSLLWWEVHQRQLSFSFRWNANITYTFFAFLFVYGLDTPLSLSLSQSDPNPVYSGMLPEDNKTIWWNVKVFGVWLSDQNYLCPSQYNGLYLSTICYIDPGLAGMYLVGNKTPVSHHLLSRPQSVAIIVFLLCFVILNTFIRPVSTAGVSINYTGTVHMVCL